MKRSSYSPGSLAFAGIPDEYGMNKEKAAADLNALLKKFRKNNMIEND